MTRQLSWLPALLLGLAVPGEVRAQCDPDDRPLWVNEAPAGYAYDYYTGQAEDAESPVRAKGLAISNAIAAIIAKGTITVQSEATTIQAEVTQGGENRLLNDVTEEVKISGHSTQIEGLEQVAVHLERCDGAQRAWVLIRLPAKEPREPPSALSPLWRSLVVPGWGQLHKDQLAKGFVILGGEAVLIPTAVIAYLQSDYAAGEAKAATRASVREEWRALSDNYYYVFLVSGGVAAALYVYNLIDAVATPRANAYAGHAPAGPRLGFVWTPSASSMSLALEF